MANTEIMVTDISSQSDILEVTKRHVRRTLNRFVEAMPSGEIKLGLLRNPSKISCDGIILLASGKVCPVFRGMPHSLRPLRIARKSNTTYVKYVCDIIGIIIPCNTLADTVKEYNDTLIDHTINYCGDLNDFIIGHKSFKSNW